MANATPHPGQLRHLLSARTDIGLQCIGGSAAASLITWATYASVSGSGGIATVGGSVIITIRYNANIAIGTRFVWAGNEYYVSAIDASSFPNQYLVLTCMLNEGIRESVKLVFISETIVDGKIVRGDTETKRTVTGYVAAIDETEFYGAAQAGYSVTHKITLWAVDYQDERIIERGGERYHVERVNPTSHNTVELSCGKSKGRS